MTITKIVFDKYVGKYIFLYSIPFLYEKINRLLSMGGKSVPHIPEWSEIKCTTIGARREICCI